MFYQRVQLLKEIKEIRFENLFVDGTKIEANANKYSFVWKKSILKSHDKLNVKIETTIQDINKAFQLNFPTKTPLKEVLDCLNKKKEQDNITFVSGSGKRKSLLQKSIETLEELCARQAKYQGYEEIFQGRNLFKNRS